MKRTDFFGQIARAALSVPIIAGIAAAASGPATMTGEAVLGTLAPLEGEIVSIGLGVEETYATAVAPTLLK